MNAASFPRPGILRQYVGMVTGTTSDRLDRLACERLPGGRELRHARTAGERRCGLAGLDGLAPEVGLHIPRCRSVHTIGMRFALDLLWLDGEGRIVRVDHAVPARRVRGCRRARSVIEVAAGQGDAFAALLGGPDDDGHDPGSSDTRTPGEAAHAKGPGPDFGPPRSPPAIP